MRLLLLTLSALICSAITFGQNLENQDKIVDFLGQEKFNQIQSSNPDYLIYLDTRIENGFAVIENEGGKFDNVTVLDVISYRIDQGDGKDETGKCKNGITKLFHTPEEFIEMYENGTLNILKYMVEYDRSKVTYYRLGNTSKILVIYPVEYINKLVAKKS